MFTVHIILLLFATVQCTYNQYIPFQLKPAKASNGCDSSSNSALIEQFFNLIFSEFHSSPPVCVCVQMCADQPMYCYPNGCLKVTDTKKKEGLPQTLQVTAQQHGANAAFMVDDQTSFVKSFFDDKSIGRNKGKVEPSPPKGIQRPDPFKDKYKAIFKSRKTPKVHLRYNLREQVKNTKSDVMKIEKVDLGKPKWSMNDKQYFVESPLPSQGNERDVGPAKYTPFSEKSSSPYSSRFFKRDLGKSKSKMEEKIAQKVDENEEISQNSTFSLENLIENLIESSFGPLRNDTELDLNVNLNYAFANNLTTREPITLPDKPKFLIKNSIIIINETTNVVSMNMSDENIDQNKYMSREESNDAFKNVYQEMIAKLSKNIDKQNNNSMEIMEMYLGSKSDNNYETTKAIDTTTVTSPFTERTETFSTKITEEITTFATSTRNITIAESTSSTPTTLSMGKNIPSNSNIKSRQKINRKLHNGKIY